ncbi:MAG: 20S proteasome subunit alpha 7, PSMA3 [Amphiamblys sp. WSBS2006]|nr:MAG: 20S proteasome subunit alpha 7, PSMA3 [Amphiamblys sp. WSBS2006]
MTSIGSGYDLSAATYSPEGKIHQIEYAMKAVETADIAVGVKCSDGVVLATKKRVGTPLLEASRNRVISTADVHIGTVFGGHEMDGLALSCYGRKEAMSFHKEMDMAVSAKMFGGRMARYVHAHTLYASIRPFGVCLIIGAYDKEGPSLHMIKPSGLLYGYTSCCVGRESQAAETELGKTVWGEKTCVEAVDELVRVLAGLYASEVDAKFELEMSWIGPQSGYEHAHLRDTDVLEARLRAGDGTRMEIE